MLSSFLQEKRFTLLAFFLYKQNKFHSQLSKAWRKVLYPRAHVSRTGRVLHVEVLQRDGISKYVGQIELVFDLFEQLLRVPVN